MRKTNDLRQLRLQERTFLNQYAILSSIVQKNGENYSSYLDLQSI